MAVCVCAVTYDQPVISTTAISSTALYNRASTHTTTVDVMRIRRVLLELCVQRPPSADMLPTAQWEDLKKEVLDSLADQIQAQVTVATQNIATDVAALADTVARLQVQVATLERDVAVQEPPTPVDPIPLPTPVVPAPLPTRQGRKQPPPVGSVNIYGCDINMFDMLSQLAAVIAKRKGLNIQFRRLDDPPATTDDTPMWVVMGPYNDARTCDGITHRLRKACLEQAAGRGEYAMQLTAVA